MHSLLVHTQRPYTRYDQDVEASLNNNEKKNILRNDTDVIFKSAEESFTKIGYSKSIKITGVHSVAENSMIKLKLFQRNQNK